MPETVLVTGASGFIGRALVRTLKQAASDRQIIGLSTQDGDIAEEQTLTSSTDRNVRHVYHVAARTFVPDSWIQTRSYYRTNVLGTQNVMEFCRATGASVTFLSSFVYGIPDYLPIDELHPLRSLNPYSNTKILAEEVVNYYARQFGVPSVIIRPFNIFGPGQSPSFLIPAMLEQAVDPASQEIVVADDRPKRDYLFIEDLVELLLLAGANAQHSSVYNAGSGTSTSVREVAAAINELIPVPKPLRVTGQHRPAEVLDVIADITHARTELGWQPKVLLSEGLGRTIAARNSTNS
jgi:nucleoside-diphosphate-sugar epimerase